MLRNHLSSIKSDENSAIQARLIFEAQVAFLVDCNDLLIEELIHKGGRIQQKMNESRKRVENELLKKWIEQYAVIGWDVVNNSKSQNKTLINELRLSNPPLAKAAFAKKLLNYVQSGKLTISGSFKFQNFGELIQSVDLTDKDAIVTKEDLEMLINGDYPIGTPPEITRSCLLGKERENEEKIALQEVLEEVSTLVVHHNPSHGFQADE
jgi:hypothetical protein